MQWAEKLRFLNMRIIYIKKKQNKVVDRRSRILFYTNDCSIDQRVGKMHDKIKKYSHDYY